MIDSIRSLLNSFGGAAKRVWKHIQSIVRVEESNAPLDLDPGHIPEDLAWIFPPQDVYNASAWDKYWADHIKHGMGPDIEDMFCRDDELVKGAQAYGLRTVLCVGNGISREPVALSLAGLQVTAMDISPVAVHISNLFRDSLESVESFFDPAFARPHGSVEYFVGDLFNEKDCPGPFDIVIERRTIQDYPESKRAEAVACILSRLASRGILLSHCHDNKWNPVKNPGSEPYHATRSLIEQLGISICRGTLPSTLDQRIAIIFTSTG